MPENTEKMQVDENETKISETISSQSINNSKIPNKEYEEPNNIETIQKVEKMEVDESRNDDKIDEGKQQCDETIGLLKNNTDQQKENYQEEYLTKSEIQPNIIKNKENDNKDNLNNEVNNTKSQSQEKPNEKVTDIYAFDEVEYVDSFKATSDMTCYKIIRLKNGLTAFLISNTKDLSDNMGYCSLCINVGSFNDPPDFQGLAHCLEKVTFLTSDTDADEDLAGLISDVGGSIENYTDSEYTTFSFEVPEQELSTAMGCLAQCFTKPLVRKETIPDAPESTKEQFNAFSTETKRSVQLLSSLAPEGHPANKFPFSTSFTLKNNVSQENLYLELQKFRQKHYSAHKMTLVVQAQISIDKLENYVKTNFSNLPVNDSETESFAQFKNEESFVTEDFRKIYKIKSINENNEIFLTWVLPTVMDSKNKIKPHEYISWIIAHEGKGSLINFLREKNYCTNITCENNENGLERNSMYSLLTLSLTLTEEGKEKKKEILDAIFSFINLLIQEGPQERIHNEIKALKNIEFHFYEEHPLTLVRNISKIMQILPNKCVILIAYKLFWDFDSALLENFIKKLGPNNVNIIFAEQNLSDEDLKETEQWYNTKYSKAPIPDDWITSWETVKPYHNFHLPEPNKFIAQNFEMIDVAETPSKFPGKILENNTLEIWHKLDIDHEWPGCYIYLYFIGESSTESINYEVIVDLYLEILKNLLRVSLFDAVKAGLHYELYQHFDNNIVLKIYGLHEKLPVVLTTILEHMADFHNLITTKIFDSMKLDRLKFYASSTLDHHMLIKNVMNYILLKNFSMYPDRFNALCNLSFKNFKEITEKFHKKLNIQCLAEGNVAQKDIIDLIEKCVKILNCEPLETCINPYSNINQLLKGEKCCKLKVHGSRDPRTIIANYYQSTSISIESVVCNKMLMEIIKKPSFNTFQNQEEGLGYKIYCKFLRSNNIFSIISCCDSKKFPSEHAENIIQAFLNCLIDNIKDMDDEEFDIIKSNVISAIKPPDMYMKTTVDHHWYEIVCKNYLFDRFDKEAAAVQNITVPDFLNWLHKNFEDKEQFKKLSIQILGYIEKEDKNSDSLDDYDESPECGFSLIKSESENCITDLEVYKKSLTSAKSC